METPPLTLRDNILAFCYLCMVGVAIFSFVIPMTGSASADYPAGSAGLFAPIVALSVAATVLLQGAIANIQKLRRLQPAFIGLGSMASAYLWMADAADTHPTDPALSLPVLMLFGMAGAFVATAAMIFFVRD